MSKCQHHMVIVDMIGRCKYCDHTVNYRELQDVKKGLPKTYDRVVETFKRLTVPNEYPVQGHVVLPMETNKYYVDEYVLRS